MNIRSLKTSIALFVSVQFLVCASRGAVSAPEPKFYESANPTPYEQYMLELINRARLNPLAEAARYGIDLNEGLPEGTITARPKQPLTFNPKLLQAARDHSQWMLDNDVFAHVESNGSDPKSRMLAAGYVTNMWYCGENIAWSGTTAQLGEISDYVADEEKNLFVDESDEGRSHRLNLLNDRYGEIGIGVQTGVMTDEGTDYNSVMVTQDFAGIRGMRNFYLFGVIYKDANGDGEYSVGEGIEGVTITAVVSDDYTLEYYTKSSTSGGYAIPLMGVQADLRVTFSGTPLEAPIIKDVILFPWNAKVDVELTRDSNIPLRFVRSPHIEDDGDFYCLLDGPAGASVMIQESSDLITWRKVATVELWHPPIGFSCGSREAHKYFRAVKVP